MLFWSEHILHRKCSTWKLELSTFVMPFLLLWIILFSIIFGIWYLNCLHYTCSAWCIPISVQCSSVCSLTSDHSLWDSVMLLYPQFCILWLPPCPKQFCPCWDLWPFLLLWPTAPSLVWPVTAALGMTQMALLWSGPWPEICRDWCLIPFGIDCFAGPGISLHHHGNVMSHQSKAVLRQQHPYPANLEWDAKQG